MAEVAVDLRSANAAAGAWCVEVNAATHSEICAIPAERLEAERGLLAALPSPRPEFGAKPTTRKVDKLSCVRFASGRYSVPNRLIGNTVTVMVNDRKLMVLEPVTGEVFAEHTLVPPGRDQHRRRPLRRARPDKPRRAARPRTAEEKAFLGLGPVAEAFLTGAVAAGVTKLTTEIGEILTPQAAPGHRPAPGRARAGREIRQVEGSRRPLHPRSSRCRTKPSPSRGGAGVDPADGADQVAGRLPNHGGDMS